MAIRLDEENDKTKFAVEEMEKTIEAHYGLGENTVYVWKFANCPEGSIALASIHGGDKHAILVRADGTCVGA